MTRKHRIFLISAAIVTVIGMTLALASCSSAITADKLLGFSEADVARIEMINEDGVQKNLTYKKSEIFSALNGAKLNINNSKKNDYEWESGYGYKINFYLNGEDGYYSLSLNHGGRAMDGFKYKKSKTGFYDFEELSAITDKFHDIFYL